MSIFSKFLPKDNEPKPQWWTALPKSCEWMVPYAIEHTRDYEASDKSNKAAVELDAKFFYRLTVEAQNDEDAASRCRKFSYIIHFWPYARKAGRYFWRS